MTQDLTAAATGGKMTLRETIAKAIEPSIVFDGFGNHRMEVARSIADAALEAIRAVGPTEAMVEAGARALALSRNINPDAFYHAQGEAPVRLWVYSKDEARACLTAALAAKET